MRVLVKDTHTEAAVRMLGKAFLSFGKAWQEWADKFTFVADQLVVIMAARPEMRGGEAL